MDIDATKPDRLYTACNDNKGGGHIKRVKMRVTRSNGKMQ